jgi:hypothetical protein
LSKQNYQRAHIVVSGICQIFPTKSNSSEIEQIVSQALFMKGSCEFELKSKDVVIQTFQQLSSEYADQEIAMPSYFEEMEYFIQIWQCERIMRDPCKMCGIGLQIFTICIRQMCGGL